MTEPLHVNVPKNLVWWYNWLQNGGKNKKKFLRPKAQWSKMFLCYVYVEQAWTLSASMQHTTQKSKVIITYFIYHHYTWEWQMSLI